VSVTLDRALLFGQPGMHKSVALAIYIKKYVKAKEEL
jgi:hypothetical protein